MRRLFLDDVRTPQQCMNYMSRYIGSDIKEYSNAWDVVKNYSEFVEYIEKNGVPHLVSFDHDLADVHYDPSTWTESFEYLEETGYDCAKWLCEYCATNQIKLPKYYIHSQNPVGRKNIQKYLENYAKAMAAQEKQEVVQGTGDVAD